MKLVPKQMNIYTKTGKLATCDPDQVETLKKAGWSLKAPVKNVASKAAPTPAPAQKAVLNKTGK